jgi:sulfatase maturation enzyme AslB (radical SAM superfamily)
MRALIFKDKRNIFSLAYGALRWYINYFLTRNPLPLACDLYITSKCNLKCSFCNIWRKQSHATLPLSEARGIIDNLSNLGCFYLSVSGGEPLLVDYIFDLLLYVRGSKIKYIHMVTNGYLLDSSKAKRLKETGINEVSISIDGTRQFHDEKRGAGDSYDRAVEAVENIKEYAPNTKIVLNTILWPREPFECLHVVELARLFDVYVKVQPLNQHPIFDTDNSSVISSGGISQAEIKEVVTRLRKEKRVVNSGLFLENIYNFFFEKKRIKLKNFPLK